MLIPVFSIIAENVQQKTRVPTGIIAAASVLIMGIGATLFAVRLGNDPHYASDFLPLLAHHRRGGGSGPAGDLVQRHGRSGARRLRAARSSRYRSRSVPLQEPACSSPS
jgi:hypothetical protein